MNYRIVSLLIFHDSMVEGNETQFRNDQCKDVYGGSSENELTDKVSFNIFELYFRENPRVPSSMSQASLR